MSISIRKRSPPPPTVSSPRPGDGAAAAQRLVVLVVLPQPRHGDLMRDGDVGKELRAAVELPPQVLVRQLRDYIHSLDDPSAQSLLHSVLA
jgi:hypothetical protein